MHHFGNHAGDFLPLMCFGDFSVKGMKAEVPGEVPGE